jgi:Tol biopolymer transport system component
MRRVAGIAGVLCAAMALAVPADATFKGRNGLVAYAGHFTRGGQRVDGIWTMRPDGSRRRRIVTLARASEPVWSPNGRLIAFAGGRRSENGENILVVRANGHGLRHLARDGFSPRWSPSGKRVDYQRVTGEDEFTTWTVSAAGGRPRRVQDSDDIRSADGTMTARLRESGALEIDVPGRPAVVVEPEHDGRFTSASWSPDNRWLLFGSYRRTPEGCNGSCSFLFSFGKLRRDGSGLRYFEHDFRNDLGAAAPQWSPNSLLISYCHPHVVAYGRRYERWVMNADGSHRRFVTVAGCDGDWQARPRLRKALPAR